MDIKIKECLLGKHGDYILPFLWLHGEPRERIYEEILAIKNSGVNQFCAESRPYEKFCQDEWWGDFEFILETAKSLDMRVWLLDDKKFPTGYANGYLERPENAHLRKRLIREFQIDVIGPAKCSKMFVGGRVRNDEKIIQVVAFRHADEREALDYRTAISLTSTLNDGMIYWDIPEGNWRVCVTVESSPYESENDRLFYYIDMLNPDSCHAMIDAIYQPHYERFSKYFGNTFAGFFSDEPGFLNVCGTYYNKLGIMYSPYPWRDDLPELIAQSAKMDKKETEMYLVALWEDLGEITALIRAHYMDVVTRLYSESFTYMLGNWCRERNVMYIGHVIEDMGAHVRLGYGSGHFFRALDGQDMAGIDIVLAQDVPGINCIHRAPLADGGSADPDFFRYTLPKLASSHSHIQPLKKGRAMCEIFGAFGWAEGLPFMKGLADIMLASGINHFVPHAFSPTREDKDCPPHFYNGGNNIQYPYFKNLMDYMGRCSHILNGGTHKADVAVFYNAEGEWSGGKNQLFFEICKILTQGLIDFDIVPYDALENAKIENNKLCINGEEYGALIVSESEILPYNCIALFEKLALDGLEVIFTDSLPTLSAEGKDISNALNAFKTTPTNSLVKLLRAQGLCHLDGCGQGLKFLRFYHVQRDNKDIYLFSNEAINDTLDATLTLEQNGEYLIYEPWENRLYRSKTNDSKLHLQIEKGNMLFVIFGEEIPEEVSYFAHEIKREALPLRFEISAMAEGENEYKLIATDSECFDITAPNHLPDFSGKLRYKASFVAKKGAYVLDLGQVGEVATVYLNGEHIGIRICAPYKFDISRALQDGENHLEIIVTSNLGHKRRDGLSSYIQIPPTGIIGEISLCEYSK
ncbi:MAG: hypothetical protein IJF11_02025 [Clostridia bacterium]|nr:hypothetical protein [Clostridia bacterium]